MSSEGQSREPEEESADTIITTTTNDAEQLERHNNLLTSNQLQRRSSVVAKDKENGSKSTLEERLSSKMFTYARETICFFLAVAFTALAALHSS